MLVKYTIVMVATLTTVVIAALGEHDRDTKQLIVIDTDPGIDDFLAILMVLGDPNYKVLAITCVRGNVLTHQAVINVFRILQLAKRSDVPVYSGGDQGLVETTRSDGYFGADGVLNVSFPVLPDTATPEGEHAAVYLARVVKENPGKINFLALGPLTNFALAIRLNPEFLCQAQRVVILGGSVSGRGNVAPGLEFNFQSDAAAAHVVLEQASLTNCLVTIMPMETVVAKDLKYEWRWDVVSKINNSVVRVLDKLELMLQKTQQLTAYHPYDVYAAADMLSDEFVSLTEHHYGFVEHEGQRLRGYLSVDFDNFTQSQPNLDVVLEVNIDVLKDKIVKTLSTFV